MAAQLGITKPTLYYYVPSKADLVHACAMLGFGYAQSALQRVVDAHAAGGLAKALNAYASVAATDFGWCMVRVDEYALPAGLKKGVQVQRKALEQLLQPLMPAGTTATMMLRAVEGVALSLPKPSGTA